MAKKTKTREINIVDESGVFATFFKKFTHGDSEYDFDSLSALRRLLSNQKAKMLYTIKTQKPGSLYNLAKILKRDFKSVSEDVKLLQRFGFVEMISEKSGRRNRLKPILASDTVTINIKI